MTGDVWAALGQPKHYIEPFFGSGAVLLNRPAYDQEKHIETVCDKDGFIANVWRGIQYAPDETAKYADWPVNHADLCARRKFLISHEGWLLEHLVDDPEWCDPRLAGYWIWAASCWIGSGLTQNSKSAGQGVNVGQTPHLAGGGRGVCSSKSSHIHEWFDELSNRLRKVRVVCGDWTRVCGGDWLDAQGTVGMFFDPPYGVKDRDKSIYHHDSTDISADVNAWCLKRGEMPSYRIVIAGYGEHENLLSHGWTAQRWKAMGGYGNRCHKQNRYRETLYFSPHCQNRQITLGLESTNETM